MIELPNILGNDLYILPWTKTDEESVDKMWDCWKSFFVKV